MMRGLNPSRVGRKAGKGSHQKHFSMSNVSGLNYAQVSEVSSHGEASQPNFAPKMVVGEIIASPYQVGADKLSSYRQSRGGASGRLMAIKGSALGLNKDSRQHTPEKILNIKIHKSEVPNDCETKENTKDQLSLDKSKDEGKTVSHKTSNREKNGKVDPQEWMRDQELSGK